MSRCVLRRRIPRPALSSTCATTRAASSPTWAGRWPISSPDRQPYAWIDIGYLPRFPYRTRPPRDVWTGPAAVVIGDGSASGAEVFAATFQETGRGSVIGVKSMGAVVASRQLLLPDGGELSIGVRSFRSGAGQVLEGAGVTPDREVRFRSEELRQGRDAMIEAAVEAVLAGS